MLAMRAHAKAPKGKAPYIPEPQLDAALAACTSSLHGLRDKALLLLSYNCGLRAKELAALRLMDVFDPGWQIIDTMRLTQTKGNKFREVPLVHEKTRAALMHYIEWRREEHWLGCQEGPLFRTQRGGHFSADSLQQHFHKMYVRAGLQASSHSGRRSFATRLIERGADIYSVMTLMGHSNINTTQLYFTTSPERLRSVAKLLG